MKEKISSKNLLESIFNNPSKRREEYRFFRNYSIGNQVLAGMQLEKVEPINTYKGWQEAGRQVKKGAKAISLRMPISKKETETEEASFFYILRNNWFPLSMTEGEEYAQPVIDNFNEKILLKNLGIEKIEFNQINGLCLGFAKPNKKQVAISPIAQNYHSILFHEVAHCILHCDEEKMVDGQVLEKDLKEFEAEATAYVVSASLGLDGLEYNRDYIKNWILKDEIKPANISRVFSASKKILDSSQQTQ
jgi:hypothetical protein